MIISGLRAFCLEKGRRKRFESCLQMPEGHVREREETFLPWFSSFPSCSSCPSNPLVPYIWTSVVTALPSPSSPRWSFIHLSILEIICFLERLSPLVCITTGNDPNSLAISLVSHLVAPPMNHRCSPGSVHEHLFFFFSCPKIFISSQNQPSLLNK